MKERRKNINQEQATIDRQINLVENEQETKHKQFIVTIYENTVHIYFSVDL